MSEPPEPAASADEPAADPSGLLEPGTVEPLDPAMLAEVLEALAQRQQALERTIDTIWRRLGTPTQHGPWAWRALPPDRRYELLTQLRDWVDWLIDRYDLRGEHCTIPPCWYAHPVAVEELTALMVAWQAAYTPEDPTPSDALVNWHDRWLWPTLHRLNTQLALWRKCTAGTHQALRARPPITDPDGFLKHLNQIRPGAVEDAGTAVPDVGLTGDQVHQLLADGGAEALLPDEPLSPIRRDGQWYAIPSESRTQQWHPVSAHQGPELDALLARNTTARASRDRS
jgi:hypothetical protein